MRRRRPQGLYFPEREDHQILLEADFLVNAEESGYARAAIETARSQIFQTVSGIRLLDAMYPENVSGMAYN